MPLLDELFLQQRPLHSFSRSPRSIITHLSYWKASEYLYWLLFYSLPLLVNVLPSLYFHHYSLLVTSIHLLMMDSITKNQCDAANEMLNDFYNLLPDLYGITSCTMNAHALSHLAYFVRHWGPLWTHSAFSFENMNGALTNMIHSTRKVAKQLSFTIDAKIKLQFISNFLQTKENSEVLNYLDHSAYHHSNITKLNDNTYIIGVIKNEYICDIEYNGIQKFIQHHCLLSREVKVFDKILFKNTLLHISSYHKTTKRRSYL